MNELPLDILVCPDTHQTLRKCSEEELGSLQEKFSSGALCFTSGTVVELSFSDALVREDGTVAYLIREGIPTLLPNEAVLI